MVGLIRDIETLRSVIIGISEGASDEKRSAMTMLTDLLARKELEFKTFEDENEPLEMDVVD